MHAALISGHPTALRALLAHPRTDINVSNNVGDGGMTLLGLVVGAGHISCLDVLLEDGRFDIMGPISLGEPRMRCLHGVAAGWGDKLSMLRHLLQVTRGRMSVEIDGGGGSTPLGVAAYANWFEGARVLIEEGGADPLLRDETVRLMYALPDSTPATNTMPTMYHTINAQGETYLMGMAKVGQLGALKFFLNETPLGRPGAEGVDAVDRISATALFYACWHDKGGCVRCVTTVLISFCNKLCSQTHVPAHTHTS